MSNLNIIENVFNGNVYAVANGNVFDISEWAVRDYQGNSFIDNFWGLTPEQATNNIKYYENELSLIEDVDTSEMGDNQWAHCSDHESDIQKCLDLAKKAKEITDWTAELGQPIATNCEFDGNQPVNEQAKQFAFENYL